MKEKKREPVAQIYRDSRSVEIYANLCFAGIWLLCSLLPSVLGLKIALAKGFFMTLGIIMFLWGVFTSYFYINHIIKVIFCLPLRNRSYDEYDWLCKALIWTFYGESIFLHFYFLFINV